MLIIQKIAFQELLDSYKSKQNPNFERIVREMYYEWQISTFLGKEFEMQTSYKMAENIILAPSKIERDAYGMCWNLIMQNRV